jgi:hypothetical protein
MPAKTWMAAGACLAALAGSGGSAATPAHAATGIDQQAAVLVFRVQRSVEAHHSSCRLPSVPTIPTFVAGGAGPEISRLLGVFRRPATAEDQASEAQIFAQPIDGLLFAEVPRDGVRVIHPAEGPPVTLVAATRIQVPMLPPASRDRCHRTARADLAVVTRHAPVAVRRAATRLLALLQRADAHPLPASTEGLETIIGGSDETSAFLAADFLANPPGFSVGDRHGSSQLTLVLPDGVASADLTFSRYSRPVPGIPRIDLGHTLRSTARVTDNVLSLRLADRGGAFYLPRGDRRARPRRKRGSHASPSPVTAGARPDPKASGRRSRA